MTSNHNPITYHELCFEPSPEAVYPKVLVWSANHETAVFGIHERIHPKAVCVWIQFQPITPDGNHYIEKHVKSFTGEWTLPETCQGFVDFVNHNPFEPKGNAASNTADSVFLPNMRLPY